ncbi:MAG: tellurite resistance TerB family protein [Caulobacterales bacterium]
MPINADKIIDALRSDPTKALDQLKADIESGGRTVLTKLKTDPAARNLAIGLGAGALGGMLAGRSKLGATVTRVGGVAALGGLAWFAYKKYQASKGEAPPAEAKTIFLPGPSDSPQAQSHGKLLLRAMIAAARSDGRVDNEERARLFDRLGQVKLDEDEQTFLFNELSQPVDLDALAAEASDPAVATQVYAAAAMAIDGDSPEEEAFLTDLAQKLKLDPSMAQHVRDAAGDSQVTDPTV